MLNSTIFSSIERLESELDLLNKQSDSLVDLEKVLEEEKSPEPPAKSPPNSPSTLASDSEDVSVLSFLALVAFFMVIHKVF
jgi:hypothetical protein